LATLAERLGRTAIFASAGKRDLAALARAAKRRRLKRGAVLFARGEESDAVALVLFGRLDVTRDTEDGDLIVLRSLGLDALVGLSTVAGAAHSANVVAGEDSELLIVPGRAVRSLFQRAPHTALAIAVHLADLLGELTDDVEELRLPSIEARIVRRLGRIGKGRRELRITHAELAATIGATRPNVSRALERLERRGVLRRHRGRIELL
jgi:CRP-like cAMP-binding protein